MQHELQGIQAFVKIAEIGCFTKASQFLHISQPALTRRIQKLEESLGTTLFELVYFQKHAPKEVLEHWNILVGRQPSKNIGLRTEDGWDIWEVMR